MTTAVLTSTRGASVIPQIDLTAQYRQIKGEIAEALLRVVQTGRYVLGPEVEAFEDEFARFYDSSYAVGVNSGTSALYLSLVAAGIGPARRSHHGAGHVRATASSMRSRKPR